MTGFSAHSLYRWLEVKVNVCRSECQAINYVTISIAKHIYLIADGNWKESTMFTKTQDVYDEIKLNLNLRNCSGN